MVGLPLLRASLGCSSRLRGSVYGCSRSLGGRPASAAIRNGVRAAGRALIAEQVLDKHLDAPFIGGEHCRHVGSVALRDPAKPRVRLFERRRTVQEPNEFRPLPAAAQVLQRRPCIGPHSVTAVARRAGLRQVDQPAGRRCGRGAVGLARTGRAPGHHHGKEQDPDKPVRTDPCHGCDLRPTRRHTQRSRGERNRSEVHTFTGSDAKRFNDAEGRRSRGELHDRFRLSPLLLSSHAPLLLFGRTFEPLNLRTFEPSATGVPSSPRRLRGRVSCA